jgi:osmotically-inducible protein OsmY
MEKRTKRLVSLLALAAGALGAGGAVLLRKGRTRTGGEAEHSRDVWARPGMSVTFRAEVMPGRETSERTYRVEKLLPSGRVLLQGVSGEHAEKEFEPIR